MASSAFSVKILETTIQNYINESDIPMALSTLEANRSHISAETQERLRNVIKEASAQQTSKAVVPAAADYLSVFDNKDIRPIIFSYYGTDTNTALIQLYVNLNIGPRIPNKTVKEDQKIVLTTRLGEKQSLTTTDLSRLYDISMDLYSYRPDSDSTSKPMCDPFKKALLSITKAELQDTDYLSLLEFLLCVSGETLKLQSLNLAHTKLEGLSLSFNPFILPTAPDLETLNLSWCFGINQKILQGILSQIIRGDYPKLQTLNLTGLEATEETMQQIKALQEKMPKLNIILEEKTEIVSH